MTPYERLPVITQNLLGETVQQGELWCYYCQYSPKGYGKCKACTLDPHNLRAKPSKFKKVEN